MRKKLDRSQLTLAGSTITEEEFTAAVVSVPSQLTNCPFCLGGQNVREMVYAAEDPQTGKLKVSKMLRCKHCKKRMRPESATVVLKGEHEYGRWAAAYPFFWKIADFDRLKKAMEDLQKARKFDVNGFWDGYHEVKPKKKLDEGGVPLQDQGPTPEEKELEAAAKESLASKPKTKLTWVFQNKQDPEKYEFVEGYSLEEDDESYFVVFGNLRQPFKKRSWSKIE